MDLTIVIAEWIVNFQKMKVFYPILDIPGNSSSHDYQNGLGLRVISRKASITACGIVKNTDVGGRWIFLA